MSYFTLITLGVIASHICTVVLWTVMTRPPEDPSDLQEEIEEFYH